MIKYEFETLVLDSGHNKKDQDAVNSFVANIIAKERGRIFNAFKSKTNGYENIYISIQEVEKIINNKEGK